MSAVPSPTLDENPKRVSPRHPIHVPLDLIALRSGVPENLPGRCTDISETGVGAVVAGELAAGQQIAVELRPPHVGRAGRPWWARWWPVNWPRANKSRSNCGFRMLVCRFARARWFAISHGFVADLSLWGCRWSSEIGR